MASVSVDLYRRLSGSAGFFNAARSVLLFAEDPEADEADLSRRVLVHGKCNVGPHQSTLRLHVEPFEFTSEEDEHIETSRVVVDGEVNLTAGEVLAGDKTRTKAEDAATWLHEFLSDGKWHDVAAIQRAVKQQGPDAGWRTFERAAQKAGVEKDKAGMDGGWRWRLGASARALTLLR